MASDRTLRVIFAGDAKGFKNAAKEAEGASGGLEQKLKHLAEAAAAAFAVGKVVEFAKGAADKFQEVGSEVLKLQRYTGGTAEEMSRLRFAAEETGTDTDKLGLAMGRLSKAVVGSKNTVKDFGFQSKDAHGKTLPLNTVLLNVAQRFATMPAGAEKTALALKIFGKSGADLLPFLNRGKQGLADLEAETDKYGLTLTGANLDAVRKSIAAHRENKAAMEGLQVAIGAYLLPVITELTTKFTAFLIPAIKTVAGVMSRDVQPVLKAVVGGLEDLVSGFVKGTDAIGSSQSKWAQWGAVAYGWFVKVKDAIGDVVGWVRDHLAVSVAFAAGVLLPFFLAWALDAGAAAVATISATAPLILLALAVGAVAAAAVYAYTHWKGFHDAVDAFGRFVRDKAWPAIKAFFKDVKIGAEAVISYFRDNWPAIQSTVMPVFKAIGEAARIYWGIAYTSAKAVADYYQIIFPYLESLVSADVKVQGALFRAMGSAVETWWGIVQPIYSAAVGVITTRVMPAYERFGTFFENLWRGATLAVQGAWATIMPIVIAGGVFIGSTIIPALRQIEGAFNDAWSGIVQIVAHAWTVLEDIIGRIEADLSRLAGPLSTIINDAGKVASVGGRVGGSLGGLSGLIPIPGGPSLTFAPAGSSLVYAPTYQVSGGDPAAMKKVLDDHDRDLSRQLAALGR